MTTETQPQAVTDGFQLIIDGLKLNDIDTIYGLPGIPITDFARKAQAAGLRVISFRHEQNAGNAASADQCDAKQRRHVECRVPRHPSNDIKGHG